MHGELEIEDTFQITNRGLVIAVKGDCEFHPGRKLAVIVKDSNGSELFQDIATQELLLKRGPNGAIESIAFLMSTAKKSQVPLDGRIVVVREVESLPDGWHHATEEDRNRLEKELERELPQGHPLYQKSIKVIAHRDGATDDILCKHIDEPERYTVVHLTWSMKTEIDENHPSVEMDGTFQDFRHISKV